MKIAICGHGLEAIEAALHFENIGALPEIFTKEKSLGEEFRDFSTHFPNLKMENTWEELTSELGRSLSALKIEEISECNPTYFEFLDNYIAPLLGHCEKLNISQRAGLKRVHKRFLNKNETVKGKSRLVDMFRVVFEVNPEIDLEQFKNLENNEVLLKDLKKSYETFRDYDVVVDCLSFDESMGLAPGGVQTIGERDLLPLGEIIKGRPDKEKIGSISNAKNVVIVGTGRTAALWSLALEPLLLSNPDLSVLIATDESAPFSKLKSEENKYLKQELDRFFIECQKRFNERKAQKPDTESQVKFLCGSNVMSIDKLQDQEGIFLSFEMAAFRNEDCYEEQNSTHACDKIIVASGMKKDLDVFSGLNSDFEGEFLPKHKDEPGYYSLTGLKKAGNVVYYLSEIEKDLMNYFSKA